MPLELPTERQGFLRVVRCDAASLDGTLDLVGALHDRSIDVILVHRVFEPEHLGAVAARLRAREAEHLRVTVHEPFRFYSIGRCLDLSGGLMDAYLRQRDAYTDACASLFRGLPSYDHVVGDLLRRLAGHRDVGVPNAPDGLPYMHSTIRNILEGGFIPPHAEREQLGREPYQHLRNVIDPSIVTSHFVPLHTADAGGDLRIYDFTWEQIEPGDIIDGRTHVVDKLANCPSEAFAPAVGDMICFDGGRLFHQVDTVARGERGTMGGFLSRAKRDASVYYWS